MPSIDELKELTVVETPLLVFDCELADGAMERWSTHAATVDGHAYAAKVLKHNLFEISSRGEEGIDAVARLSLTLANADSHFSEVERNIGWKGAKLTAHFLFFDLKSATAVSERRAIFRGSANPPEEITESSLRLTFTNRLNLQRVLLPELRIQRRCPWAFPSNSQERGEAVDGGVKGRYSRFYRCGYSPDVAGGAGSGQSGTPYTSCDHTRQQCQARGMFDSDEANSLTRRFGGIEFVPPSIQVRSHGERGQHVAVPLENEARYNDFVPLVYGTAWYQPPVVFARNDGNLTHIQVLLASGEIQGVLKVVVNDVEIPEGRAGADMTATGWYNTVTTGARTGAFDPDYVDGAGKALSDPYGSMAVMSVVAPNRVSEGRTLPRIDVLVEGLKLPRYDAAAQPLGEAFTNNPCWVVLDILRRSGWGPGEIDLASFARAAQYSDELIETLDLYGNTVQIPRYQCNLVVRKRRSAGDLIRGIRAGSALLLTLGPSGLLELRAEGPLATEQPTKPASSNSTQPLNGGWPAYEFGDGSSAFSGILRDRNGAPALRLWSRSTADTPNRFSVEFQDAFNEYQQDSLSLVDVGDVGTTGHEVSGALGALGLPNLDQAARATRLQLEKSVRGNAYLEFATSVRAIGLLPGDLIAVTYLKEGFQRQPFRILRVAPGMNYQTSTITAQIHSDSWYSVSGGAGAGAGGVRRQPRFDVGLPRPLVGAMLAEDGTSQFGIAERSSENSDGSATVLLSASFSEPRRPAPTGAGIPLLSLAPTVRDSGGTLAGAQTLYYAVSAVDASGGETRPSFIVKATIAFSTNTNSVTLTDLSFSPDTAAFNVYRGRTPEQLLRIASAQPKATEFVDAGRVAELVAPPDENFDHANFYWRLEFLPEQAVTIHSANSVGNDTLHLTPDEYRGATVRITQGKGAGQERVAASNSATTLTVSAPWSLEPDGTSVFVVSESSWHAGARAQVSPAEFEAPNREGATVHISGRAANVRNQEAAYELSPLTRWQIGGAGGQTMDAEVPGPPVFGLYTLGEGSVELAGVAFESLANTRTVTAATLALHYWDELSSPSQTALAAAVAPTGGYFDLTAAGSAQVGDLLQVEAELVVVEEVQNGGLRLVVHRGSHGTTAADHAAQKAVYGLRRKTFIAPFAKGFFGSPASGNFSYPIHLPDARIAAADLFVTNSRGDSPTTQASFTATVDRGLRTLSGGQMSIQVEGPIAIQTDAAPPLVVQETHAVRDVFAVVREAPAAGPVTLRLLHNGVAYCDLTIPVGAQVSNVLSGFGLAPLQASAVLRLDVLSVGQNANLSPGRDLTVTLRL